MQHVPPPIRVTHTFPRTNLSHPICGLSPFILVSGSSWKQVTCVASQGPSPQHEDFQQTVLTSQLTPATQYSWSFFFFRMLLIFLQLGQLLLLEMLPLVFTLHGQGIGFYLLNNIAAHVISPRSHATSTGSLSLPRSIWAPDTAL